MLGYSPCGTARDPCLRQVRAVHDKVHTNGYLVLKAGIFSRVNMRMTAFKFLGTIMERAIED